MIDNDKAILTIRGEKPVVDKKYDILQHPNVKSTTDGQAKAYEHGTIKRANVSISQLKLDEINTEEIKDIQELKQIEKVTTELLSEEDIENYYLMEDYENERKKENNQ